MKTEVRISEIKKMKAEIEATNSRDKFTGLVSLLLIEDGCGENVKGNMNAWVDYIQDSCPQKTGEFYAPVKEALNAIAGGFSADSDPRGIKCLSEMGKVVSDSGVKALLAYLDGVLSTAKPRLLKREQYCTVDMEEFCMLINDYPRIRMGSGHAKVMSAIHSFLMGYKPTNVLLLTIYQKAKTVLQGMHNSNLCLASVVSLLDFQDMSVSRERAKSCETSLMLKNTQRAISCLSQYKGDKVRDKESYLCQSLCGKNGFIAKLKGLETALSPAITEAFTAEKYHEVLGCLLEIIRAVEEVETAHLATCLMSTPFPISRRNLGEALDRAVGAILSIISGFGDLPKPTYNEIMYHDLIGRLLPPMNEENEKRGCEAARQQEKEMPSLLRWQAFLGMSIRF